MEQKEAWNRLYKHNKNKWKMETAGIPRILNGKNILEVGVGNGKTLGAIIKQNPKEITAVDFSEEAIKELKVKFIGDKIRTVTADLKSLPFGDSEFDMVICYYTLDAMISEDRKKAVDEMHRVIKKGGKMIFEDFAKGDFREKSDSKFIEENTIQNKDGIICHFFDIPELKRLFSEFSSLKLKEKTSSPITHRPELKRNIISGIMTK